MTRTPSPESPVTDLVERLRDLSFSLAAGSAPNETDPLKLLARIEWGVEQIQQVEAKRTADLIEELSKTPKTTWGAVKKAVLERAGALSQSPATGQDMVERVARRLAARKMGLRSDANGERLPSDLWTQCIPDAEAVLSAIQGDPNHDDG